MTGPYLPESLVSTPRFPALLLLLLGVACGAPAHPARPSLDQGPPLAWREWGPAAFAEARRTGRVVLVDVGIEGCTACRHQYETTYADPIVRERMARSFVSVAVDAHARPDFGSRYEAVGWPATLFFTADGTEVRSVRGNKLPHNFLRILDEVAAAYARGHAAVARVGPTPPPPRPTTVALQCRAARDRLAGLENRDAGGWEVGFHQVRQAPIEWAWLRAVAHDDAAERRFVQRTAEGYARLIDPVWGGVFVAAFRDDWSTPIPEKRTLHQAAALVAFARAFEITRDPSWLARLEAVRRYLADFMRSPEGTYYATQEDVAPGLPPGMSARQYYALGDAERRRYGVPPVDRGVYAHLNGLVIEAQVVDALATGHAPSLADAARAAARLLETQRAPEGWIYQTAPGDAAVRDADRMRRLEVGLGPFLEPQARVGRALLALHRATGEARWLDAARAIGAAVRSTLRRPDGVLFSGPADVAVGAMPRLVSVRENAMAADFLGRLGWALGDESLVRDAEAALAAADPRRIAEMRPFELGEVALSANLLALGPLELTVVAEPGAPGLEELRRAAAQVDDPRAVVRVEPPGHYPSAGRAAVMVCDRTSCSSPVTDPAAIAEVASRFRRVAPDGDPCGAPR